MLQKVSIQNFKSLKDVTLELQKVNLLIGPNNSGKSNFLKALEKYSVLLRNPNSIELRLEDNHFKSPDSEIMFSSMFLIDDKNLPMTHLISRKRSSNPSDIVRHEFGGTEISVIEEIKRKEFIDNSGYPHLLNTFHNLIIYKPDPISFQKPFPLLPHQLLVNYDASNLVGFLDTLRDEYTENYEAIENDLNKCIPELSGLRFENVEVKREDDLYKIYGDKTFKRLGLYDKNNKLTYWADELSEGTLYFLALLCIVHQPNPPKLLLLEEPEKGIHPRRIKEILDFIFQLVEDKDIQVIMTTHSERVLDEFEDIPEAVFIFDKDEEGATQVKNLLKDVIEPSNQKMEEKGLPKIKFTDSLGSHWVTGFIGGVPK